MLLSTVCVINYGKLKMKILIIYNTEKYTYHKMVLDDFRDVISSCRSCALNYELSIVNISDDVPNHILFKTIEESNSDLIINLDFCGFTLRTEGGNISLNGLHSRIVNVMFKKPEYYTDELSFRQNLSMFTYFPSRIVAAENDLKKIVARYPNIPNPRVMCEYDYKAISDGDKEMNLHNLKKWIGEMFEDVMKLHRFRGKICIY